MPYRKTSKGYGSFNRIALVTNANLWTLKIKQINDQSLTVIISKPSQVYGADIQERINSKLKD